MSSLRKTFSKVKHVLKDSALEITSPIAHHDKHNKSNGNGDGEESKGERRARIKREEREEREARNSDEEEKIRLRRIKSDELAAEKEPKELRMKYGQTDLVEEYDQKIVEFKSGEDVKFRARVHTIRKMSSKLAFIVFRQQIATIQGVIHEYDNVISTHMVRWAERIPIESLVLVGGKVQRTEQKITGTSIHDMELVIEELHVLSPPINPLPFTVYQAEEESLKRDSEDSINDRQRLSNRLLELRTPTTQSIFRINAAICNIFRTVLNDQNFIEIHTPKLQAGATESGSSVFEVNYFNRAAYLAQSPQLMKQMSLAGDFDRVYEIGPVFRAENSNTHRHLTEYVGLDLEMTLRSNYYEAMDVIDETLKSVFKGVNEKYRAELEIIKRRFPHEDLVWLERTPRITFAEGIQLLVDSGWTQDEKPPSANEDLSTPAEIRLGELVKEKYYTDYYILDKFPTSARPFYTMLDSENSEVTNSFDIFLRGQEIVTGGQRIHDAEELENRMKELGVPVAGMEEYLEGFEYGAPPHAGCGIGLERLVMLLLNLGNIRFASLFPRDPKSLPEKPRQLALRHEEASTSPPPWKLKHPHRRQSGQQHRAEHEYQSLEKLIANYGDASNTSWLDERYKVWRHESTGAAIGYVPSKHDRFAIIVGNPLCASHQYSRVIHDFLRWLKETHLKPLWILVDSRVEEVLGGRMGWITLTCAAEERVNNNSGAEYDREVQRKIRHAKSEGITVLEVEITEEIQKRCDEQIKEWLENRNGRQIHLTNINPWLDPDHRRYFLAEDSSHKIHALVVLAQLSSEHGYQVKYSLDFPGAPSGTIEYIITTAMEAAAESGAKSITFGAAASSNFTPGHHLKGMRVKMLKHSYKTIAERLSLINKSEFREKLGAEQDAVYICYPKHGLGTTGVKAIMEFFSDDE